MRYLFLIVSLVFIQEAHAQPTLIGKVVVDENGKEEPLYGANVWWENTDEGTVTLEDGVFEIPYVKESQVLVISFVGYKKVRQPIEGKPERIPPIKLEAGDMLNEVVVREVISPTKLDAKSTTLTYEINRKELRKAACCNVAESFETNPAVDVSFSDALTGARQIEMLGLSGKYAPMQIENIPFARGVNTPTGLAYTPGPWVNHIHLSKGIGTVVNGFESSTGLIDVELFRPLDEPQTHLNAYLNSGGRNELNLVNVHKHNDVWRSAHLLHASSNPMRWDMTNNGFMDMPLGYQINGMSRWSFDVGDHWRGQFGVHYIRDQRRSGQMNMDFSQIGSETPEHWGMQIDNARISAFAKIAYLFDTEKESSIGLITNAYVHEKEAHFGRSLLDAGQDGMYANLIYQLGNSEKDKWVFKGGLSLLYDDVYARYTDPLQIGINFPLTADRREAVTGAFGEMSWKPNEKISAVGGLRVDNSSLFGTFVTPRLHFRYSPQENTIIRLHGGRGQRTPLPFIENYGVLASNRRITGDFVSNAFQHAPEVAWNSGLSLQREFRLFYRKGSFVTDVFYTYFENQLITDFDRNPLEFGLYSGEGSYSRGFMMQLDYEVWTRFDVRMAYKYIDSKMAYETGIREMQMLIPHRSFVNLAYETRSKWAFDFTLNWFGSQRLPDTDQSPAAFQLDERAPSFFLLNGQVSKDLNNKVTLFLGVENLLNFRQNDPIVNAEQPFSPYFDSSMIWGPIFGRMAYLRVDVSF